MTDVEINPETAPNPATTNWVPVGPAPPAPTGGGLTYRGDYSASVTYNDGDIVVGPDGITYACTQNGIVGTAPVPWTLTPPATPYAITLPSAPSNGQETILVDSTTNPSYQWRFRYNAGSTCIYKWEFVGGTHLDLLHLGRSHLLLL